MASPKTIERMLAFHGFPPDAGDKEINDHLDTAEQAADNLEKNPPVATNSAVSDPMTDVLNRLSALEKKPEQEQPATIVTKPLFNKATAQTPDSVLVNKSSAQKQFVNSIRNANPKLSFNEAWNQARESKPELFKNEVIIK